MRLSYYSLQQLGAPCYDLAVGNRCQLTECDLQLQGAPCYDLAVGNRCQLTECDDGLCTPNPFMSVERQKQDHE